MLTAGEQYALWIPLPSLAVRVELYEVSVTFGTPVVGVDVRLKGQVMTGLDAEFTTENEQFLWFPARSNAVHVTVELPTGKA